MGETSRQDNDGEQLTEFQVEAEKQTERINEAREAAERVKESLAGLKYKSMSFSEESGTVEINPQRKSEINQREKSLRWLSYFGRYMIGPEDLKDARFFSLEELSGRRKECAFLENQISEGLRNFDSPECQAVLENVLQRARDEYAMRDPRLFDIDEKTGKISLKLDVDPKTVEEIIKEAEHASKFFQHESEDISDIIKNSRTNIDPGVLVIAKDRNQLSNKVSQDICAFHARGYNGDLKKVGLIVMPPVFSIETLRHEYSHFEDALFEGDERKELDFIITELNSYFSLLPEVREEKIDVFFDVLKAGIAENHFDREPYITYATRDNGAQRVMDAITSMRRLYTNGFSFESIKSVLLHAKKLEDVSQWNNVSEEEISKLAENN